MKKKHPMLTMLDKENERLEKQNIKSLMELQFKTAKDKAIEDLLSHLKDKGPFKRPIDKQIIITAKEIKRDHFFGPGESQDVIVFSQQYKGTHLNDIVKTPMQCIELINKQ